jgi:uncharacterized protein YkwD
MARLAHLPLLAFAVLLACACLAGPAAAAPPCKHAGDRAGEASDEELAAASVCLMNKVRGQRGLRPLKVNRRLARAATAHSEDMVERGYFSHFSRSGGNIVTRLRRVGYLRGARAWFVGENLAWGTGWRSTPREIWRSWMRSSGHRSNILNGRFREVGVGVVLQTPRGGHRLGATYTTAFGMRRG